MKDALIVTALSILPRKRGAWIMGWFARTRVSRWITGWFVRAYGLNMDEASEPTSAYATLEQLFTRTLKPDARPIDPTPEVIVSPVDGTVAAVGMAQNGHISLTPHRTLDLNELLGTTTDEALDAVVIYLSPKDYHRVHYPREGVIRRWAYIPGSLWPVFPAAVRKVNNLFSRNERALVHIESSEGPIQVVMVGAFGVGRMSLACCDLLTNTGGNATQEAFAEPIPAERGAHLGTFHLGSTVVIVVPAGQWNWELTIGQSLKMGQPIGRC